VLAPLHLGKRKKNLNNDDLKRREDTHTCVQPVPLMQHMINNESIATVFGIAACRSTRMPWRIRARLLAKRNRAQIVLFPGVDTMLAELHAAGIQLAVVSSNSEDTVRHVLGPENAARITYYACGASVFAKQAHFRRVLKRSGMRPAHALCIGDEIRDYEAATAVGMPFGAVAWGYTTIEALTACAPAEVFHQVEDIIVRLAKNEAAC
jgi:phosphoglycolate phosphatase-like HAD superfamily hydrolase